LISLGVTIVRSVAITTPRATTTNGESGGNEASVPLCVSSNVRLIDRGSDVGMGSWIQLFQLRNSGNHACSISGYPRISLVTAHGIDRTLAVTPIKYEGWRKIGDSRRGPLPSSTLAANGGVASFWIAGSDTPTRNLLDCRFASKAVLGLPRGRGNVVYEVGRIPFSYCENEIAVTPILPGRSGSLPAEPLRPYDLER
jgi:hypothetical protein